MRIIRRFRNNNLASTVAERRISRADKQIEMLCKLPLLLSLGVLLQAQVHVPHMGFVRCSDASVRAVYGVPGAFVIGQPVLFHTSSSSFSASGGIVATQTSVLLLDTSGKSIGEFPANDSRTLVNIGSKLSTAIAWLAATQTLLYWDESAFHEVKLPVPISGRVTSIRRDGSRAMLLVWSDGVVSEIAVSLDSGDIQSETFVAGVSGPAFRESGFILFPSSNGLEIEGPTSHTSLPLPSSDLSIERMTSGWLHLASASSGRNWALHVTPGILELFQLPSIPRVEIAR